MSKETTTGSVKFTGTKRYSPEEEAMLKRNILSYFEGDQLATDVWFSKYRTGEEIHPVQMFNRCAMTLADKEQQIYGGITIDEEKMQSLSTFGQRFFKELLVGDREHNEWIKEKRYNAYMNYFDRFRYIIPGGSMLSGIGVLDLYQSLSNCLVLGQPSDSYAGILFKEHEIVQTLKRRCGIGADLSTVRPENAVVHNQSQTSSGVILFAERYSNATREVAMNGRRGAAMLSLNVLHPDIMAFVKVKRDLSKITGANISIIMEQEFMDAIEKDDDVICRFPVTKVLTDEQINVAKEFPYNELHEIDCDGETVLVKRIKAKELFEEFVYSNWFSAEPGLLFKHNIEYYATDTCYPMYRFVTTNPCSEIPLSAYDCCRLSSTSLYHYVENKFKENASVNYDKLYEVCYNQLFFLDTIVSLEIDHINHIIEKIEKTSDNDFLMAMERDIWVKIRETCERGRRCGVGIMGLSDMIAAMNLPYDVNDERTCELVNSVMATKMRAEMDASIDLAIVMSPFEGFDAKTERETEFDGLFSFIRDEFPEQWKRMQQHGRRNVSWSTIAPTGSTGIEGRVTGGMEPLFIPYYKRRKKCTSPTDRVDFVDVDGEKFTEYFVVHAPFMTFCEERFNVQDWTHVTEEEMDAMFKQSPYYNNCADNIDYHSRILMQSMVQKYTTHSISSTINLPADTPRETIAAIYMDAWRNKLKGITVYREGSRGGVIVKNDNTGNETFEETKAPKRPRTLKGDVHVITYRKQDYFVVIGLYKDRPYECFVCPVPDASLASTMSYPARVEVIKRAKNHYAFECDPDIVCENIQHVDNEDIAVFCLMVSTMMRHRVPLKFICKTIEKANLLASSFEKQIVHVLNTYLPDEITDEECPECKSKLRRENGCKYCPQCGYSKC